MDVHIYRLLIGLVHELFNLIQSHQGELTHAFLVQAVKQLPRSSRRSWDSLIQVGSKKPAQDDLGKLLLKIRNQAAFHYDSDQIFRGFKAILRGQTPSQDRAYISRGPNMEETRFYFADAAIDGYLQSMVGMEERTKVNEIFQLLDPALSGVIDRFIQRRRFAYKSE